MSESADKSGETGSGSVLAQVETGVSEATEVAGAVAGVVSPELSRAIQAIGAKVSQVEALARDAHSLASDVAAQAKRDPDTGLSDLLQDVVNFLHWAFPGHHNLPGVASPAHPVTPSVG